MPVYGNSRPQFTDANGNPLSAGTLYIGMPDQDPIANPGNVTDLDGNPISAVLDLGDEGVPTVAFKIADDFSQAVYDRNGVEVIAYQISRTGGFLLESDLVGVVGQGGDWNNAKTYGEDDFVKGSDGDYYISLTDNNLGNDPTATTTAWSQLAWPTLYNANESYDISDTCIALNGVVYLSAVNSNVGNDPIADDGTNWTSILTQDNTFQGDNTFSGNNDFTGDFKKDGTSTVHTPAGGTISAGSTLGITKGILSAADGGVIGGYRAIDITLSVDATAASGVLYAVANGTGALAAPLLWGSSSQIDIDTVRILATTIGVSAPNFADCAYTVTIFDIGL